MIVLNILGYFGRNKQSSYAALNRVHDHDDTNTLCISMINGR